MHSQSEIGASSRDSELQNMSSLPPQRFFLVPAEVYQRLRQEGHSESRKTADTRQDGESIISGGESQTMGDSNRVNSEDKQTIMSQSPRAEAGGHNGENASPDYSWAPIKNLSAKDTTSEGPPAMQHSANIGASERSESVIPSQLLSMVANYPKRCRTRGVKLLQHLQKASLKWDETGTVYKSDGEIISGSDIKQIVRQLISPLPGKNPPGEKYVRDFIRKLNVPEKILYKAKSNCAKAATATSDGPVSKPIFRPMSPRKSENSAVNKKWVSFGVKK